MFRLISKINYRFTQISHPEIPKTVEEALSIPEWYQAMKEEFQSLEKNKVWELSKLPKNRNLVSGKWDFTLKRDGNGKIIMYKARYVARGFNQKRGVDFEGTFSPTVKMVTLKIFTEFCGTTRHEVKAIRCEDTSSQRRRDRRRNLCSTTVMFRSFERLREFGLQIEKSLYRLKQSGRN